MSAPPRRHCGAQNTTGSCSLQSVPNTGNVCTALDTGAVAISRYLPCRDTHWLHSDTGTQHCLVPASSSLNQYRGQCCWSGHSTWTASDSQRPQEPVLVVIRGQDETDRWYWLGTELMCYCGASLPYRHPAVLFWLLICYIYFYFMNFLWWFYWSWSSLTLLQPSSSPVTLSFWLRQDILVVIIGIPSLYDGVESCLLSTDNFQ